MPEQPFQAPSVPAPPKLPVFSIESLIAKFNEWFALEGWKLWVFLAFCIVIALFAVYMIYDHYLKSPVKMRKLRLGKFKLSSFVNLKGLKKK